MKLVSSKMIKSVPAGDYCNYSQSTFKSSSRMLKVLQLGKLFCTCHQKNSLKMALKIARKRILNKRSFSLQIAFLLSKNSFFTLTFEE